MKTGGESPWWLPLVATAVGALLALIGGYLARRVEDRRARRATIVTEVLPPLVDELILGPHVSRKAMTAHVGLLTRHSMACGWGDSRRARRAGRAITDALDVRPTYGDGDGYGEHQRIVTDDEEAIWDAALHAVKDYEVDLWLRLSMGSIAVIGRPYSKVLEWRVRDGQKI